MNITKQYHYKGYIFFNKKVLKAKRVKIIKKALSLTIALLLSLFALIFITGLPEKIFPIM